MAFTFALFCLHEFSNITQIMAVLQYMDVHQLPVTPFTLDRYDMSPVFSLNCMRT